MTKVISLASLRAGAIAHTSVTTTTTNPTPAQQAAIENALVMALHFIRQPGDHSANLWAATARTHRALTMLKHAGGANAPAAVPTVFGRA